MRLVEIFTPRDIKRTWLQLQQSLIDLGYADDDFRLDLKLDGAGSGIGDVIHRSDHDHAFIVIWGDGEIWIGANSGSSILFKAHSVDEAIKWMHENPDSLPSI